jgi:putative Holliday junction resolvase
VDFGDRRTGVAVSDPLGYTAQALETVVGDMAAAADRVCALAREYGAAAVVVGHPRNMDGSEGPRAARTRAFAEELRARGAGGARVELWDERLTSVAAERAMREMGRKPGREKARVDMLAAAILLQGYLDNRARNQ